MGKPDPAVIANHIEQLPFELFEHIFATLTFRDVIALVKHAGLDSRLAAGLAKSPKWRSIWPTYLAHQTEFQALAEFIVPIGGGRMFDPTGGALDVTPGQYYRRMAREKEYRGASYDFFQHASKQALDTVETLLDEADPLTLALLSQRISLKDIAEICSGLKGEIDLVQRKYPGIRDNKDIQDIRARFYETLGGRCRCYIDQYFVHKGLKPHWFEAQQFLDRAKPCVIKHPGRGKPEWTVRELKVFLDAYSVIQAQVNKMKASQLQALAELYARHHSRLREPYAPHSPRLNVHHIPNQLQIVSQFVLRIVDLDRNQQPRTKQGKSRFRYHHACLVPYDWCLQLLVKVGETNPRLALGSSVLPSEKSLSGSMESLAVSSSAATTGKLGAHEPPADILAQIQVVNDGLRSFYQRSKKWGQQNESFPRIAESRGEYSIPQNIKCMNHGCETDSDSRSFLPSLP